MTEVIKRYDVEPAPQILEEYFVEDKINRHASLLQIVDLIYRVEGAYTLFVDGPWGCGKTYVIRQIVELMKHENSFLSTQLNESILENFLKSTSISNLSMSFIPIYFNAWNHDHYDDPLCPLLCEMALQLDQSVKMKERNYIGAILGILDSVLPVSLEKAFDNLSGKDIMEDFKKRIELRKRFDALIDGTIVLKDERLVLFIDELDRCRPEFAIRLLEQTKQLFNNPKIIVVVSTDSVQLGHALGGVYGETFNAKKYLERFYDRKIELSKVDSMEYLELLGYVDHGYIGFQSVLRSIIEREELTMRDLQKMAPVLIPAKEFSSSYFSHHSAAATFATNGLLPGFIVIAYSDPELWRKIKDANQYDLVYEYLKDIQGVQDLAKHVLSGFKDDCEEIREADRKQFILDVCMALFADRKLDGLALKAHERLGIGCDVRYLRKKVIDFCFD